MKILALDYGVKRIGYAIGDTKIGIAFGREVIQNISEKAVMAALREILETENIERIVIGLPKLLSGDESGQTRITRQFAEKLQTQTDLPVDFCDERLSTVEAVKNLHTQNFKAKLQKDKRDVIAAAIILQQYLDQNYNFF